MTIHRLRRQELAMPGKRSLPWWAWNERPRIIEDHPLAQDLVVFPWMGGISRYGVNPSREHGVINLPTGSVHTSFAQNQMHSRLDPDMGKVFHANAAGAILTIGTAIGPSGPQGTFDFLNTHHWRADEFTVAGLWKIPTTTGSLSDFVSAQSRFEIEWQANNDVRFFVGGGVNASITITDGVDDGTAGALATDWNLLGLRFKEDTHHDGFINNIVSLNTPGAGDAGNSNQEIRIRGPIVAGGMCAAFYMWKRALSLALWQMLDDDPFCFLEPAIPFFAFFQPSAGGAIAATPEFEFDVVAALTGGGLLAATPPIEFNVAAALIADGLLAATPPIEFDVSADLTELLSAVLPIEFDVAAELEAGGQIAAAPPIEFSVAATLVADGALLGTPPIEFNAVGNLGDATGGSISAAPEIEFDVVAALVNSSIPLLPFVDRRHIAAFIN